METNELDIPAPDTHLVASTEGKGIIGRFSLLVVIDAYSRLIVSCGSSPDNSPHHQRQSHLHLASPEAVMTNQAVLE